MLPSEEYKLGHLPYRLETIKITDIKVHGDGPFPFGEVNDYAERAWLPALAEAYKKIEPYVQGKKEPRSEDMLKILHKLMEIYRVQGILSSLKKGVNLDNISLLDPNNRLVDGKHRIWAYMLHGDEAVRARIYPPKKKRL